MTGVDPSNDMVTVEPSAWGPLVASTPILFGPTAAQYGLTPGMPYYIATTPTRNIDPNTKAATYSFKVSTKWLQQLSMGNVPIQYSGTAGPVVHLSNPGSPINLQWGPIQPVSQLGSQQLTSGRLAKNPDGSVTIWIAPTLPARGTRHQLDPHTIDGLLQRPLPRESRCRPRSCRYSAFTIQHREATRRRRSCPRRMGR